MSESSTVSTFANLCATLSHQKYDTLPKTGKCGPREWSVLASILLEKNVGTQNPLLEVIVLATGTKCVGSSGMHANGVAVHDSHAEVICRRRFIVFLEDELEKLFSQKNESDIFKHSISNDIKLRDGIKFHMYISQAPCGDACIFPLDDTKNTKKRPTSSSHTKNTKKRLTELNKIVSINMSTSDGINNNNNNNTLNKKDFHRTGGKPVAGEIPDPMLPGSQYHTLGVLRTKPGRGSQSSSLTCTRWTVLGLQGALLSNLLQSQNIFLSSICVSELWNEAAMFRAIIGRIVTNSNNDYCVPRLFHATKSFKFSQYQIEQNSKTISKTTSAESTDKIVPKIVSKSVPKIVPCGFSISWSRGHNNTEVLLSKTGLKSGTTKKNTKNPPRQCQSILCKSKMFARFIELCKKCPISCTTEFIKLVNKNFQDKESKILLIEKSKTMYNSYHDVKHGRLYDETDGKIKDTNEYQKVKFQFHEKIFKHWPKRKFLKYENFTL
eukprot:GSMAST32.ASY1.ANO1.422.1 assembled CDS